LKVFAGERIPDDKGFRERLAVVNMLEGSPESNIKMLTDQEKTELLQLRNAFLLYKMQNLSSDLSKLETELKQRDRELWEGFLQVVHGTKYFAKCMETAAFYTNQRHETIWNSLEARIFKLIKHNLTQNLDLRLEEFWQYLINEQDILSGVTEKETFFPHDFNSKITRNYLSKLFEQKFYAKRKSTYRTNAGKKHLMTAYQFNTEIISTLTKKYNVTDDVVDDLALDATSGGSGGSGQLTFGFEAKADHVDHVDDLKEAKNTDSEAKTEQTEQTEFDQKNTSSAKFEAKADHVDHVDHLKEAKNTDSEAKTEQTEQTEFDQKNTSSAKFEAKADHVDHLKEAKNTDSEAKTEQTEQTEFDQKNTSSDTGKLGCDSQVLSGLLS
jgi:hypothetical protein